jgi:AcrR family transcriptional regulator
VGLRERKKTQVRERIVEAALALFERQGFAETTIDEIAAAAEVSRRTIFRYFASKEDLVFLGQAAENRQIVALIQQTPRGTDPVAALLSGTRALFARIPDSSAQMVRSQRLIERTPALRAHKQRLLQEVRDILIRGLVSSRTPKREALRLELLASVYLAALDVVSTAWLKSGGKGSLEDGLVLVEEVLTRGFRS